MRHLRKINSLSRTASHRKALMSNMAVSLLRHKRIQTTVAKAKALREYVEPLITRAKEDTTHSRRVVFSYLRDKAIIGELYGQIADKVGARPGGYTRIIRLGRRKGDAAETCMIELVDFNPWTRDEAGSKKAKSRRSRRSKGKSSAASKAAQPTATTSSEDTQSTESPSATVESEPAAAAEDALPATPAPELESSEKIASSQDTELPSATVEAEPAAAAEDALPATPASELESSDEIASSQDTELPPTTGDTTEENDTTSEPTKKS